jgi:hypothetical protein
LRRRHVDRCNPASIVAWIVAWLPLQAVIEYLRTHRRVGRIALWGRSMGAVRANARTA